MRRSLGVSVTVVSLALLVWASVEEQWVVAVWLLSFVVQYPVAAVRFARWQRRRRRAPNQPWMWDSLWLGGRMTARSRYPWHVYAIMVPFWLGSLALVAMLVLVVGATLRPYLISALFGALAWFAIQRMRQRPIQVAEFTFHDPPFRVGETARMTFSLDPSNGHLDALEMEVRCVPESRYSVFRAIPCAFEHVVPVELPPHRIPEPGGAVELEIPIPADAPGTDVVQRPACYWEFHVEGHGALGKFERTFLLPVYASESADPLPDAPLLRRDA